MSPHYLLDREIEVANGLARTTGRDAIAVIGKDGWSNTFDAKFALFFADDRYPIAYWARASRARAVAVQTPGAERDAGLNEAASS